jgi:membrane protease YdiL (CAAX protease family)
VVVIALLLLVYVLQLPELIIRLLWGAATGAAFEPSMSPGLRDVFTREGLAVTIATTAILAPAAEELVFRGMLLQSLAKTRLGFWGAAVLSSLAFAAMHAEMYGGILNILWIVPTGMVLALALRQTGSLWAPIVIHVAVNSIGIALLHFGA